MEEKWKDIQGFNGEYQISSLGRIRSIKKYSYGIKIKYLGKKQIGSYSKVAISSNGIIKNFYVHELVAIEFLDYVKKDRKICINHINGERSDNRLENLEIVTQSYNVKDGFIRGRKGINKYIKLKELYGYKYNNCLMDKINFNTNAKTIYMYDLDMNFLRHFCSSIEAERVTGIKANNIRGYISRGKKYTCNGIIFKHELILKDEEVDNG